jgi:hypothetical protein
LRTIELFKFIQARHAVWLKKQAGFPKPWTQDPILQKYRFCNVYRELDTTTQWIAKNWRKPNTKDPHLWFAMVVARLINWPETLGQLGYVGGDLYTANRVLACVGARQAQGLQVYGGAYTISTNGRKMLKHNYLVEQVFNPLWANREQIELTLTTKNQTLQEVHTQLMAFQGLGSFMAAQVIADLKYAQLKKAPDWWTWAASGPGSRRGLNRVCGVDKDKSWREDVWLVELKLLHEEIGGMVAAADMPPLHAQDLQNCLCEFDKYQRVLLGEGRPRSLYPGI